MKYFSIFLIFNFLLEINCEYYSSTDKLREVFEIESAVLNDFVKILKEINEVSAELDDKIEPWLKEHVKAIENIDEYLMNPLNAYLLIKRNVHDVLLIQQSLESFIDNLQAKLKCLKKYTTLERKEVNGTVASILRLQRVYHLKSEDLVEGIIDGAQTRKPLSPHDIYVMANESYQTPLDSYFSKSYFEIAIKSINNGGKGFREINETEVQEKLEQLDHRKIEDPFNDSFNVSEIALNITASRMVVNKLCRGNLTRLLQETKNLRCRFSSFSSYTKIAPFKLEEASIDPYIVLYHDVMSDEEVHEVIELGRPKQQKAKIGIKNLVEADHVRLSQISWLSNKHDLIKQLNSRFEDMTGLNMETSENLQMQNYGIAGAFNQHYDMNQARTDETSYARMATLMLYVSFASFKSFKNQIFFLKAFRCGKRRSDCFSFFEA
jgi:prolyl 4-hydroxylase